MMKYSLALIFAIIATSSCKLDQKSSSVEIVHPFAGIKIDSVIVEQGSSIRSFKSEHELIDKLENYLSGINKDSLIKGKRLHGAKTIGNVTLFTSEKQYLINIKNHKEEGVTASFFEEKKEDNFSYSLGRLYNAVALLPALGLQPNAMQ